MVKKWTEKEDDLLNQIDDTIEELYKYSSSYLNLSAFGPKKGIVNGELVEWSINESELKEEFHGDSLRISQILTNLIGNAMKFTDNGEIVISVKKLDNDKLRFEVKDTGIGLSKEHQEKLFKSFSQADDSTTRKYGGTGLGLAISKQLVELMDGKIWVESEKNIGSNFIFELKLQEVKNKQYDKKSATQYMPSNVAAKKILIAEDNLTNQLVLLGLLEDYIEEIDVVNNGKEAVKYAKINKYELILMDIQMPVMDGYEATEMIRIFDKNIPIIALTANAMKEDIQKTIDAGMNEHITKPLDIKELFDTLNKYINSN